MPRTPLNSEIVTALGDYLGYGAIGLGLAVAVLSAMLLMFMAKSPGALAVGTRFMMFGLALVVIGSGLELVKAYQTSVEAERTFVSSQNLPDEFWDDFLLSRQQKLFGTAEPTDEYTSGSMKEGELRSVSIFIPKGECRFYFAAARPPARIDAMIKNTDAVNRGLRDQEYYRTGKLCISAAKASQTVELQIQKHGANGQFSISVFKAPPDEVALGLPSPVPPPPPPSIRTVKRVCTGEFEANCAGAHDAFYTCGYFGSDAAIATQLCPGAQSQAVRLNTKGGNKCGYSLIEVTCG